MGGNRDRTILILLALLWLGLRIPHFFARYSFDWDSANYARGVAKFDVINHQPHPPGYPLWVMSARVVKPWVGNAMRAQVIVAFLTAMLALAIFYMLARSMIPRVAFAATVLLAFSPAVSLYSSEPGTLIVDLLSSCVAGYVAFYDSTARRWPIVACLGALGALAGFRQSGVVLLVPLIIAAMVVHWRNARREVIVGVGLGVALFLAWYIPLAASVGGVRELSRLSAEQLRASAAGTSVLYGATAERHLKMIAENGIYLAMNLAAWIVAFFGFRKFGGGWRYAVWLVPNLVMLFGVHGARAGYWLLSLPPLILMLAAGAAPSIRRVIAGVVVSLAISYFPYGRMLSSDQATPYYLAYRSAPRMALDLEASQRSLEKTLLELRRGGEPEPYVCVRNLHEAPNIRTVMYDFPFVHWTPPETAPATASIWLFDARGPDAEARKLYTFWKRIDGDELYSVWRATP